MISALLVGKMRLLRARALKGAKRSARLFGFVVYWSWFDEAIRIANSLFETREGCLLVTRMDALGDLFLWLRCGGGRFLHETLATAGVERVVLVVQSEWVGAAETALWPDREIDVVGVRRRAFGWNPAYRASVLWWIGRTADVMVNPTTSRDIGWADSMVRVSGAKRRLGIRGDLVRMTKWERRLSAQWYTALLDAPHPGQSEPQVQQQFLDYCLRSLTGSRMPATHRIAAHGENDSRRILIFPGAGKAYRRWPPERYAAVVTILLQHGYSVGLVTGPSERLVAADIIRNLNEQDARSIDVWDGTLRDLQGAVEEARLVIGNESGPIQIARMCGTPFVAIVGGGQFGRFLPEESIPHEAAICVHQLPCFGCEWYCTEARVGGVYRCIHGVSVSAVIRAISEILGTPADLRDFLP